jgi:hypothetical protein
VSLWSEWTPLLLAGPPVLCWLVGQLGGWDWCKRTFPASAGHYAYTGELFVRFALLPDANLGKPADGERIIRVPLRHPRRELRLSTAKRGPSGAPVLRQAARWRRAGTSPIAAEFGQRSRPVEAYLFDAGQSDAFYVFPDSHFPSQAAVLRDRFGRRVVLNIHPSGRERRSWTLTATAR